jgi:hypothetical protein
MSSGSQQFSVVCICTGMPPPLFHTVMVLFAGSMFTFIVSIVYERIRAPRDKRENHSVQH